MVEKLMMVIEYQGADVTMQNNRIIIYLGTWDIVINRDVSIDYTLWI